MKTQRCAVTAIMGCLWATAVCSETLTLYRSESEFLANATIVSTENFDSYATDTHFKDWSVSFDEVLFQITDGEQHDCTVIPGDFCWFITNRVSDGPEPVTSPNMLGSNALGEIGISSSSDGWDVISFGENRNVNAFGFYFLSAIGYDWIVRYVLPNFFGWEIAVHECDGTVTSLGLPPDTAAAPAYFGFTSEVGICQVEVGAKGPPSNIGYSTINWSYDSVSRSAIRSNLQDASISIRPKSINPRSRGLIRVDLVSDGAFDPLQVDIQSIRFGPAEASVLRYLLKDINRDGLADLRLWFETRDTGIQCGNTQATLSATKFVGGRVAATESIRTVPCK